MFLPVANHYELIVDDFTEKGVQITMKKKHGIQPVIPVTFIAVIIFAYFNESLTGHKIYLALGTSCIFMIFYFNLICRVHSETLLVISSIGITVRKSNLLRTSSVFYSIQDIQDVVIVEAVSMYKIIFQLVLLPREGICSKQTVLSQNSENVTQKLHPLFNSFKPKLKDLQTVYKHIQEKLFYSNQKKR